MKSYRSSCFFQLLIAGLIAFFATGCGARYGHVILEDEQGSVSVEIEKEREYDHGYQDGYGHHHRRKKYYKTNLPEIPPGHMPPPGKCRIWFPGKPPGHQPPPGNCYKLERRIPPGAWLIKG